MSRRRISDSESLPVLTASEIGAYTFCGEAWYLRRRQVPRADFGERRLQQGTVADLFTDRADYTRRLVAEHQRQVGVRSIQLVQLRMAHAGGEVAHQHLRRARAGEVDIVDDHWLARFDEDGRWRLHAVSSFICF